MTKGERIAEQALLWVGTPFQMQQACRGAGCDCLGLIVGVVRELNLPEAQSPFARIADYQRVDSELLLRGLGETLDLVAVRREHHAIGIPEVGDLLLIDLKDEHGRMKPMHLAIHAGGNRMIHTLYYPGHAQVQRDLIGSAWWRRVDSIWRWRE
jgi:NlpC/P60 family putative phage cell wall peptidase